MNTQKGATEKPQATKKSRTTSQKQYLGRLYMLMAVIVALLIAVLTLMSDGTAQRRTADGVSDSRDFPDSAGTEDLTDGGQDREPSEPDQPEDRTVLVPVPQRDPAAREVEPLPRVSGYLAVVIDDVGNDVEALKTFLAIPADITFAILPQRRFSEESANTARKADREIIMHLPMEPLGDENPGEGAVMVSLSADEIAATIEKNLRTVPGAVGANNHMGSRATADPGVMYAVLTDLKNRGLFFLDSRTSADTIAAPTARMLGMPFVERSIFLDNVADKTEIETQLQKGVTLARDRGYAVVIGHVTVPELAQVLGEAIQGIAKQGVAIEPLSAVVERAEAVYARAGD